MHAELKLEGSPEVRRLIAQTRIGRASENEICLAGPWVSAQHASLVWNENARWELRDLGSRNGTYANGERVSEGERRVLERGARLAFGDPTASWVLVEDGPPHTGARNTRTREFIWAEDGILVLPEGADGKVYICQDARGEWVVEGRDQVRAVNDREELRVGDETWWVSLPRTHVPTAQHPSLVVPAAPVGPLTGVVLTFSVSPNEEYTLLTFERQGRELWSTDRAYAYMLLLLARARLADQARPDFAESEHGWMYTDELCTMLGHLDIARLNVDVHRARSELGRAGVAGASCLVERRRGTGQLRIGTGALVIGQRSRS